MKTVNSKMTTNPQLSTTEPKKLKLKLNEQLEQEQNHRNGDHMEGYQQGGGAGRTGVKGTGNKKHKWQVQNRWGEVKNSTGNGEAKELICMTRGHELSGGMLAGGRVQGRRGERGVKKWDNYNSIIKKIYFKIITE